MKWSLHCSILVSNVLHFDACSASQIKQSQKVESVHLDTASENITSRWTELTFWDWCFIIFVGDLLLIIRFLGVCFCQQFVDVASLLVWAKNIQKWIKEKTYLIQRLPKPLEFRFKMQSPNSQSKVSLCFYFPLEVSTFLPPSLLSKSHASLF